MQLGRDADGHDLGRAVRAVAAGVLCCLPLVACDPVSAPLVSTQAGFQMTPSGDLRIWTGGPQCKGVKKIRVELEKSDEAPETSWTLRSIRKKGARFSILTLGEAPQGFRVAGKNRPLPDWRDMKTVDLSLKAKTGRKGSYVSVDSMLEDVSSHGSSEFYFEDEGWMTREEFTELAQEDEGLAPMCGDTSTKG